jgi:predicted RNA-binding Zn-ribbon protein involved in translation (DUF1610 family)
MLEPTLAPQTVAMIDMVGPTSEAMCPVCGQTMILLHEIRRAFAGNLNVFKCRPCGFSMTEPASWTKRPTKPGGAL